MSKAEIYYKDIGDYLSREEKLKIISDNRSMLNPALEMVKITPNEHGDWINQRNDAFASFIPIGDKENTNTFWIKAIHCRGLETSRDAWIYNSNKVLLMTNIERSIEFYNSQLEAFKDRTQKSIKAKDFIAYSNSSISWSRAFINDIETGKKKSFNGNVITYALYRPFFKQHVYFSREQNNVVSKMDTFFPTNNHKNLLICLSCAGSNNDLNVIISDKIVDLHLVGDTQCFPLYYYEENKTIQETLFDNDSANERYIRRDAVSDFILGRAKKQYGESVSKEDIFYYVYGFLHSPEYREKFAADLKKMLPRLPLLDDVRGFWAFSKAGRALAELHLNYESAGNCPGVLYTYVPLSIADTLKQANAKEMEYLNYRVEKMRFQSKTDKSKIIYNSQISVENIPMEAYEYVVNGKSAIEWVMERYQITTHKDSGIVNNPNDWAKETDNPRYILDLLLSVINVSVQTVKIVKSLPEVKFE